MNKKTTEITNRTIKKKSKTCKVSDLSYDILEQTIAKINEPIGDVKPVKVLEKTDILNLLISKITSEDINQLSLSRLNAYEKFDMAFAKELKKNPNAVKNELMDNVLDLYLKKNKIKQ